MSRLFILFLASIWSISAAAKSEDRFSKAELNCLALNIYHEARGEVTNGQIAVGMVTMNRLASPKYPKTVCKVVYQPKQFSWTAREDVNSPQDAQAWTSAKRIADFVYHKYPSFHARTRGANDITRGAFHYYAPKSANPQWAQNQVVTMEIGGHRFVRVKS